MKRCPITERACPNMLDICCRECNDECASKCTSFDCNGAIEMSTEMVAFENKYLGLLKQVKEVENQKKFLDEREKGMKDAILKEMQKYGISKFENEFISMTVVEAHVMQKLDTKALKTLDPETYDRYLTATEVSASLRIKVK